jgi:hypothetical protein
VVQLDAFARAGRTAATEIGRCACAPLGSPARSCSPVPGFYLLRHGSAAVSQVLPPAGDCGQERFAGR